MSKRISVFAAPQEGKGQYFKGSIELGQLSREYEDSLLKVVKHTGYLLLHIVHPTHSIKLSWLPEAKKEASTWYWNNLTLTDFASGWGRESNGL
jgi:hypothetical protein